MYRYFPDRESLTQAAIDEGIPPLDILDPMTEAMGVVGDRFSRQEIFVPEMLISARAMKGAVALLELVDQAEALADPVVVAGAAHVDRRGDAKLELLRALSALDQEVAQGAVGRTGPPGR